MVGADPLSDLAVLRAESRDLIPAMLGNALGSPLVLGIVLVIGNARRAVLEESRASERAEIVGQLKEGEVREGVVKNITDYGAFVDLGGIDGLFLLNVSSTGIGRCNTDHAANNKCHGFVNAARPANS